MKSIRGHSDVSARGGSGGVRRSHDEKGPKDGTAVYFKGSADAVVDCITELLLEMSKLQLVKLIECSDDRAYNAGVEFANYVMKSCRLVIPQELLDNDEQTYDIVKRHNELEQWEMIDQH